MAEITQGAIWRNTAGASWVNTEGAIWISLFISILVVEILNPSIVSLTAKLLITANFDRT